MAQTMEFHLKSLILDDDTKLRRAVSNEKEVLILWKDL